MGDVSAHHQRAGQRQPGLHRVAAELAADLVHGPVQVHGHHLGRQLLAGGLGQIAGRVGLQPLQEQAVGGDAGPGLAVGRAAHRDPHRVGGPVAGQADHPHVVAEVLAPELGPDPELAGQLQHPLLPGQVPEAVPGGGVAPGGQRVQVAGRGQLGRLEVVLGRGAPHHQGQVVGRAGGGAQQPQGLVQEVDQRLLVEQGLGLLVQERLVGRAPALGHVEQLVDRARLGVDLHLGGQVVAGVDLGEHVEGGELGVAQARRAVGVEHAPGDGLGVVGEGQHLFALVAYHHRGAGVLAHGQDAPGCDVGVEEQLQGHEAVVLRRLRVVDDVAELLEVPGPQVVGDVVHGRRGESGERLGLDPQERAPAVGDGANPLVGDEPVIGGVGPQRQDLRVGELGFSHDGEPNQRAAGRVPLRLASRPGRK